MIDQALAWLKGSAWGLAAGALIGAVAWNYTPFIGPAARIERLTKERDAARLAVKAWEKRANAIASARDRDNKNAVQSAADASIACDARVAAARKSAQAIRTIVTREVPRDPQGCPVRGIVPSGELRDALSPR